MNALFLTLTSSLVFGFVGATTTGSAPRQCCAALLSQNSLAGRVLTSRDDGFEARLDSYYSANAANPPQCMVLPQSKKDVATTIQVLSEIGCAFGMRSGAHSAFAGSNGLEGGVTIDFGYMNSTVYDPSTGIASIEPGSNWGDVYSALDRFGVTAVGGRASVVGVGGFTTGGGYSFHTGNRGFACDNVVNIEVVLANGTIVNANRHENANLLRALKGGSGNFGLVTNISTRAVPSNKIWGGITTYALNNTDKVVDAYTKFVNKMDDDPASQAIVTLLYGKEGFSLVSVLTNSNAKSTAPAFNEFVKITNISSTARVGSVAEMVPEFTGPTPLGLYANWMTGTALHDQQLMYFILRTVKKYINRMRLAAPSSNFELLTQFQPVTRSMVARGAEQGGNVLGLERVVADGPALMWLLALTVDTAKNQERILPLLLQLERDINRYADEKGTSRHWEFLNYSGLGQNPILDYGTLEVDFMRSVSREYDPQGVFQRLRKTGFHIPM
ncbi:Bifunctional solanapyrone synthase [Colletotrichum fructicola]|nr:Bifunctional solanapyrone synthase [Colletotrichum fructicola]